MFALFALTLLMFAGVVAILLWVRTPHYRMQRADVIHLLQSILVGQASENDWAIFLSSSFRHAPELESVRERCAVIDETEYLGHSRSEYLFTSTGLQQLRELLDTLERQRD